jgi:predicted HTH domain antitoxin
VKFEKNRPKMSALAKPLALVLPESLRKEILSIAEQEKLNKDTVVRKLLETGIAEWKTQNALEQLRNRKVTFAKAAEMAKLSLWEFADAVARNKIEWVSLEP